MYSKIPALVLCVPGSPADQPENKPTGESTVDCTFGKARARGVSLRPAFDRVEDKCEYCIHSHVGPRSCQGTDAADVRRADGRYGARQCDQPHCEPAIASMSTSDSSNGSHCRFRAGAAEPPRAAASPRRSMAAPNVYPAPKAHTPMRPHDLSLRISVASASGIELDDVLP